MMVEKRKNRRKEKREKERTALWPGFWFRRDAVAGICASAERDRTRF